MKMKGKQPLKEQMDNLIPKLRQIDNHALSNADAHTKELYMTLLAAIAFEDRKIAKSEERYLQTLCNSVKDVDFESTQRRIDKIGDTLEESLKAIEDNKLAVWLFIDALILCRLDSAITEKESKLLGSLADSLNLTPEEVSLCLKMAAAILSQDEAMLREMIAEVPKDFPFYALHEAYTSPWFEAKFSFAEDLAEGRELKGKYFIHKPVRISGERELKDIELVFAEGTSITIGKDAKLKIAGSKLNQAEIICDKKSSLTLSGCSFSGGKGIYSGIGSSLSVSQCRFENTGIFSDKASIIDLDEVIFENFTDKRAMSLTNCRNVTLKKSKFTSCGFDPKNTEKEEGGALLIKDCAILIDTCQFENCTASGDGGAISFWNSLYGIKDSKFIQCASGLNGGAMVVHDTFQAERDKSYPCSSIIEHKYHSGEDWPLCIDTQFLNCSSKDSGGAVMAYQKELRFYGCRFEKCKAPKRGGAVVILGEYDGSSYLFNRIFECSFTENESLEGSGLWMEMYTCGIWSDNYKWDINKTKFHKCTTNHDQRCYCSNPYDCYFRNTNTFTE